MSRTISPPWIAPYALKAISATQGIVIGSESRTVQVISVYPDISSIDVSDTVNKICLYLNPNCLRQLDEYLRDLKNMRFSQIRIDEYHLSTVVQCMSKFDIERIRNNNRFSFPLMLHCSKLTYLGILCHNYTIASNFPCINRRWR
jgi:hypothetical protein